MLCLQEIVETRELDTLVPKNVRLHPKVAEAFEKKARKEGCTQTYLFEKALIQIINEDG